MTRTMHNHQRIGYIRVSSFDHLPERQLDTVSVDMIFTDTASSKDTNRPERDRAISGVHTGDTLVVQRMDRLARNLDDLRRLVQYLITRGVSIEFVNEQMTFTGEDSPMTALMLTVMKACATFERALRKERQREGIALAKQRGVYRGRTKALSPEKADEVRRRADVGEKKTALAREFGISRTTLAAYLKQNATLRR